VPVTAPPDSSEAYYISSSKEAVALAKKQGTLHVFICLLPKKWLFTNKSPLEQKKITAGFVCIICGYNDDYACKDLIKWNPTRKTANDRKYFGKLYDSRIDLIFGSRSLIP
jgi:hypothetical protein